MPVIDRYSIAVDMDGVLHSYESGWQGEDVLPDPPVPGAISWLRSMLPHFHVFITSTRCKTAEGCSAIHEWLRQHGLSAEEDAQIETVAYKPPALIYIDDRAWRFVGDNFPSREEIFAARPWFQGSS